MLQPRATPCASAARASRVSSAASGSLAVNSPRSARVTRACISAAALRVKVIARICPGSSTVARSLRNRRVNTAVLPEPAGASSRTESAGALAAARAAPSWRKPGSLLIGVIRVRCGRRGEVRANAADIGEVTVVAGARGRVDLRITGQERTDQALDERLPAGA